MVKFFLLHVKTSLIYSVAFLFVVCLLFYFFLWYFIFITYLLPLRKYCYYSKIFLLILYQINLQGLKSKNFWLNFLFCIFKSFFMNFWGKIVVKNLVETKMLLRRIFTVQDCKNVCNFSGFNLIFFKTTYWKFSLRRCYFFVYCLFLCVYLLSFFI